MTGKNGIQRESNDSVEGKMSVMHEDLVWFIEVGVYVKTFLLCVVGTQRFQNPPCNNDFKKM